MESTIMGYTGIKSCRVYTVAICGIMEKKMETATV